MRIPISASVYLSNLGHLDEMKSSGSFSGCRELLNLEPKVEALALSSAQGLLAPGAFDEKKLEYCLKQARNPS